MVLFIIIFFGGLMKKLAAFVLASVTLLTVTYCGGGGGGGSYEPVVTAQSFVDRLNQVDPHSTYYVVRKNPASDPDFIVFYDAHYEETVAVDLHELKRLGYTAAEAASAYLYGNLTGITEFVDEFTPAAIEAWLNTGVDFFEGTITGYLYEEPVVGNKNLVALSASMNQIKIANTGSLVAESYGLTEEQGVRLATLANKWNQLATTRQMTEADVAAFAPQAIGVSLKDLKKTANSGYLSNDVIAEMADHLDTTPETVQNIAGQLMDL
jgi:hypothetical protein